jgi:imidazoleglycerol-phosphate dehydratase
MRKAEKERNTRETKIKCVLNIDGSGEAKMNTGIGFLDHMLELFAFWGKFDLEIVTKEADLKVDIHHANEDVGIVLGQVFKDALGDKTGIARNGFASFPMEDVTAYVSVDLSGRGSFKSTINPANYAYPVAQENYEFKYAEHFFEAFAKQLGMNLNIKLDNPSQDLHATLEPVFKALGKALAEAAQIDPRRKGVPSTKGVID